MNWKEWSVAAVVIAAFVAVFMTVAIVLSNIYNHFAAHYEAVKWTASNEISVYRVKSLADAVEQRLATKTLHVAFYKKDVYHNPDAYEKLPGSNTRSKAFVTDANGRKCRLIHLLELPGARSAFWVFEQPPSVVVGEMWLHLPLKTTGDDYKGWVVIPLEWEN